MSDWSNQKIGDRTILSEPVMTGDRRTVMVRCKCGDTSRVDLRDLKRGRADRCKSCAGKLSRVPAQKVLSRQLPSDELALLTKSREALSQALRRFARDGDHDALGTRLGQVSKAIGMIASRHVKEAAE